MKFDSAKGLWTDKLLQILFSYHIITKTAMEELIFYLAYGFGAMTPIEIGLSSIIKLNCNEEQNEEVMNRSLDLLKEKWNDSQMKLIIYQWKMKKTLQFQGLQKKFQSGKFSVKESLHSRRI